MIFALLDEFTLLVLADIAEVQREIEPYDAASGTIRFYDESGLPLIPVFPARSDRRLFGIRVDSDQGPYALQASADSWSSALEIVLSSDLQLAPNPWFATMDRLRTHLTAARRARQSQSIPPAG